MLRMISLLMVPLLASPLIVHAQQRDEPIIAEKPSRVQTVNDAWARAIWQSFAFEDASEQQIMANFAAALSRAAKKAPIYVSLGDAQDGPASLKMMLDKTVATVEKELVNDVESRKSGDDLNSKDAILRSVQKNIEAWRRESVVKRTVMDTIDKLLDARDDRQDAAIDFYLAAIAEDPNYLPAWHRLATHAEGEQLDYAIRGFIERDPDNALPLYMLAARQIERGDYQAARKSVEAGNRKPKCQWYPAPIPKTFLIRFVDSESTRKLGVAGQPISYEALLFLADSFQTLFSDHLPGTLRGVGFDFADEAECLYAAGNTREAIALIEAAQGMGIRVISSTPRSSRMMVTGLIISRGGNEKVLRQIYQAENMTEKLADLERRAERVKLLGEEFTKLLETRRRTDEGLKLVFAGKKNPIEEERVRLQALLVQCGFVKEETE